MNYLYTNSPIGIVEMAATDKGICELSFVDKMVHEEIETPILLQCAQEITEYFEGKRKYFDVVLAAEGTDFQHNVWKKLIEIPFGTTQSYGDIALKLGDMKKVRAVGMANGKNPIAVIVPCHRVIGSNGNLIGYAGGLWRKEWLLRHEGAILL